MNKVNIIYNKSCLNMPEVDSGSIDCCMTSPPYYGLRKYPDEAGITWPDGWQGQLGLESDFNLYLDHLLIITAEIKRVLKKTGSFWLNMGDTYGGSGGAGGDYNAGGLREGQPKYKQGRIGYQKCLVGIPWRLVLRLIDKQGWVLRNCITWHKSNSMPSSVKDRCSNSYEFLFHLVKNTKPQYYWNEHTGLMVDKKPKELKEKIDWEWRKCPDCDGTGKVETDAQKTKILEKEAETYGSPRARYHRANKNQICPRCKGTGKKKYSFWHSLGYWYDLDAIREPHKTSGDYKSYEGKLNLSDRAIKIGERENLGKPNCPRGKNPTDVWIIPTQPFPEAHFATFPEKLCERPILATCPLEICKKCGKARVRITKTNYKVLRSSKIQDQPKQRLIKKQGQQPYGFKVGAVCQSEHQTIGWTDCGCNAGWRPGIALDNFAGAGTALVVAKKLGRDYIGYECVGEYVRMSKKRLTRTVYQMELL